MDIYHLIRGQPPKRLETLERMPDDGFLWLDFVRDSALLQVLADHRGTVLAGKRTSAFFCEALVRKLLP